MRTILSVVTGTYNRLLHLQRMIESVRNSIGLGIPYEIIIVDGGSTDGTPEWCEAQPDVVFIQQGKLLGAVSAFNEGFENVTGKYTVIANDDIEFVGHSIRAALAHITTHLGVGIGCFYQDRGGRPFHVEHMPAIKNGKQTSVYYGQVCIIPTWLGNKVGWWGDGYHTYGGDNELSCKVLELGYLIEPVEGAQIHDLMLNDNLRQRNMGEYKLDPGKRHPDTQRWVDRWTNADKLLGPVVQNRPRISPPADYREVPMRVLYAPIYEPAYRELQTRTKRGLRDALAKRWLTAEVDYIKNPQEVLELAKLWKPHMVLMQLQDSTSFPLQYVSKLRAMLPTAVLVNWNGDYHPERLRSGAYMKLMKRFDWALFVTDNIRAEYTKAGVRFGYWPISYEEHNQLPANSMPSHDVLLLGNGYSNKRIELAKALLSIPRLDVGIYGVWNERTGVTPAGSNLYNFDEGARLYANAKISIGDAQWPDAVGYVSNRFFQALSAGAFLLHQRVEGLERYTGLVDGKHYVGWDTFDDLRDLIRYYIKKPVERQRIATQGCNFVRTVHSFDMRVRQLGDMLDAYYARCDHHNTGML